MNEPTPQALIDAANAYEKRYSCRRCSANGLRKSQTRPKSSPVNEC